MIGALFNYANRNAPLSFKRSMCTTHVPSHINMTYLLLFKHLLLCLMHTQLAAILATELSKHNKTKKKVVAKVFSFIPLQHKISPQPNVQLKYFFFQLYNLQRKS